MRRTNGFTLTETGSWTDITGFCGALAEALDGEIPPEARAAFDAWRPRVEETEAAVRGRTVDDEVLSETRIEAASAPASEEFVHAGHKLREGGNDMLHGRSRRGIHDVESAGTSTVRGILPSVIRLFRRIEHLIYATVVSRTNPDYFESGPLTATVRRSLRHRDRYTVRVDFQNPDVAEAVAERIGED